MQSKNGKGRDLEQLIYKSLREEIINLTIIPGSLIQENELCTRFEASRTPVRTVIQRLEAEGLVEIIPYKGISVSLIDLDIVKQTIFLRQTVEGAVLKLYAKSATEMDYEDINHNLRVQKILLDKENFSAEDFYALDAKLHSLWFDSTGKGYVWDLVQNLEVNYTRFRILDLVEKKQFKEIYEEHIVLFEAIKNKDDEKLQSLIEYHLAGGIRRLSNIIENNKECFKNI